MKHTLVITLLLLSSCAMANDIIKHPTNRDCLQYTLYREARGETLETIRAVMDVVHNRVKLENNRKNVTIPVTICDVVKRKGQFPYIQYGIKHVTNENFLILYYKASMMDAMLTEDFLYFNHKKHEWATRHKKIGNLTFSKEKK